MTTEADVAQALLGTWPTQVAAWGKSGIAAYLAELGARGITPDTALTAIRSYSPDADFPPSAAKLAQVARRDPSLPAGPEIVALAWGPKGFMHARADYPVGGWRGPDGRRRADDEARAYRAMLKSDDLAAFVKAVGVDALKNHDPADLEWGEANRRWLESQWAQFRERVDERGIAALLAGGSEGLAEIRRRSAAALAIEEGAR